MIKSNKSTTKVESRKFARGYVRVSTNMQKEDGVSLETQHSRIRDYCSYKKLELLKIYEDAGISGKTIAGRPAVRELITDIQKDDTIVVCDLSRLGRNTIEVLTIIVTHIQDRGAFFICLNPDIDTTSPTGMLILTVLSAVHQLERQNNSLTISTNMQRISREGKLRTKAPYGWKFVGKDLDMVQDDDQQQIIKYISNLYSSGFSINKISVTLNENGYGSTLKNGKFYPETVKRILIDCGLKDGDRTPVQQRIVSHHKDT